MPRGWVAPIANEEWLTPSMRLVRIVCSRVLAVSAAMAAPWATGLGGSRSSLSFSDGEGVLKELVLTTGSGVGLNM